MPVRPKHTIGDSRLVAERQFTDREDFIAAFRGALAGERHSQPTVLVYYGVGGIGKTSLRRELARQLEGEKPSIVHAALDFDVPGYRDMETGLQALRKTLHSRVGVVFNTFDIASVAYRQRVQPQVPVNRTTVPLLDDNPILNDLLGFAGNLSIFALMAQLPVLALKGKAVFQQWWTTRGSRELKELPSLEPGQIAERLPMFWAADLRDYLQEKGKRAVLFIDTYEALTEGERAEGRMSRTDEWVRELVAQLPEVLWVILGRERVRWEEADPDWADCLQQHLVGNLADADAERFLTSCGVSDDGIRKVVIEGSDGLPYCLDLAVDTYLEIRRQGGREPAPEDFARTPHDVLTRFLRHLTRAEVETLKVLSVPRFWDRELFRLLVKEFQTGYPLTAFEELCRFSFIRPGAIAETWQMHQLMRESLQEYQPAELKSHVYRFLFERYANEVAGLQPRDVTDRHKPVLVEAFYHGRRVLDAAGLADWFIARADVFSDAARWELLVPMYDELVQIVEAALGTGHRALGRCLNNLALALRKLGRYASAEPLYQRALATREQALGAEHPDVAQSLNNLAALYYEQGRYSEAEPLLARALAIREKALGSNHSDTASTMNNLAALYYREGRYAEAEPLYERSLRVREAASGPAHPVVATALINLASLYRAQARHADAEALLAKALKIREEALGPEHPGVAQALNNLALVHRARGEAERAEPLARRALEITEKACGAGHADVAQNLANLALICGDSGQDSEAEALFRRALTVWEQSYGPDHPYAAKALCGLATLYQKRGKSNEAESLLRHALAIREAALGAEHPDTAEVLECLAELYQKSGRTDEAQRLSERAQATRSKKR